MGIYVAVERFPLSEGYLRWLQSSFTDRIHHRPELSCVANIPKFLAYLSIKIRVTIL